MTERKPKPRVLIVDDEPDMLDFLERALRRSYRVERAQSAEEAVSLLSTGAFDVVVTDQRMPRQSGLELLARVRGAAAGRMVCVLLTGYAEEPWVEDAARRGEVDLHLRKPIDSRTLLEAIERAVADREVS